MIRNTTGTVYEKKEKLNFLQNFPIYDTLIILIYQITFQIMALEVPSSQEAKKIPPSPADQLREALDAKQPSYQEYIKSKGYLEMAVNDSEVRMAYRTIGKTQGRVGMPDHYLLDISLLLQDKE